MRGHTRLRLPVVVVDVIEGIPSLACYASAVIFSSAAISRFHAFVTPELGDGHLPTATTAARPDVLLEDPRLLLPVVICVNRPSQTLSGARVDFEGKDAACSQSTS